MTTRRPVLVLPFTVLSEPDTVRLVAGEDHRYTLRAPKLEQWFPGILDSCNGRCSVDDLLAGLDHDDREVALELFDRLYGERVLIDGLAAETHEAEDYELEIEGSGPVLEALANETPINNSEAAPKLTVFCQDRLDYAAALQFNRRRLSGDSPWIWCSVGPMSRGFVSPPFFPDAGPCLGCLLAGFGRLSPAPELYGAMIEHSRSGGAIAPSSFPAAGTEILRQMVLWKHQQLSQKQPSSALYRLHVLEVESMEVTTHRVFIDAECSECGDAEMV
jgi:hypothetical protein